MRAFIVVLLVGIVVMIGSAFFLGWLSVSADRQDGNYVARLVVHTAPIRHTTESVEQKAERLRETLKENLGAVKKTETVMGTVATIDDYGQGFTLSASDERELSIRMDPTTKVTGSQIRGLQPGDRVTVVFFETKDGQLVAQSVAGE